MQSANSSILTENFTLDQLRQYLQKKLGARMWRVEAGNSENMEVIDGAISDAIMAYSRRCPRLGWEIIPAQSKVYTLKNPGFGVWRVDFVEPYNSFGMGSTGFGLIQNLTGVVVPPILSSGMPGAGEIQQFIEWRKSFQRVTSRKPDWRYDDVENLIYIFNPVNYQGLAQTTLPRGFDEIRLQHKDWIKRMSLAESKVSLGEMRSKFKSIQGPGGQAIDLNGGDLIQSGQKEKDECIKDLKGFQARLVPQWD